VKILIVKRDKIGDLLLTTPLLAHLKREMPSASVHLLANDYNAWVVADDPDVERVWIYRRTRHAGRVRVGAALGQVRQFFGLRGERFDVAIAAGGKESPRAIHRALAAHAGRTIAYAADPRRYGPRLTDPLPPPEGGHEVDRMMRLLVPLGVAPPGVAPLPRFRVPSRWIEDARQWLAAAGIAEGAYVVVGLSARDPEKVPSRDQVLRWAARWQREHGCATLLQSTPGDATNALYPGSDAPARAILAAAPPYLRAIPDGLPAAIGLIHLARTSVLPDSGLMQFAATSPGGVAALFADCPRLATPAQWGPRGPRAVVVEAPRAIAELGDETIFALLVPLLTRSAGIRCP
jgi:ADP-heptose:LPS heptosyltransferase